MSKFKVGDKVRRIAGTYAGMLVGNTATILGITVPGQCQKPGLDLTYFGDGHNPDKFELVVEDKSKFHKHHDLIIAWAKGAKIQVLSVGATEWADATRPNWSTLCKYRIKPEHKPDVVSTRLVVRPIGIFGDNGHSDEVKCTYDGETGKLKAVELIS